MGNFEIEFLFLDAQARWRLLTGLSWYINSAQAGGLYV